jgi:hypothetical protein
MFLLHHICSEFVASVTMGSFLLTKESRENIFFGLSYRERNAPPGSDLTSPKSPTHSNRQNAIESGISGASTCRLNARAGKWQLLSHCVL